MLRILANENFPDPSRHLPGDEERAMAVSQPQPSAHIVRNPQILGGEPTIAGTRVPVRSIVIAWEQYHDIHRLCRAYPMLDPAHVEEALAFYNAHRAEIDRYIAENEDDSA